MASELFQGLDVGEEKAFLDTCSEDEVDAVLDQLYDWKQWARPEQLEPEGDWDVWAINAGRGFGKTKTGAEITNMRVKRGDARRIALVARTPSDVRDTLIEGESGILACSHPNFMPEYEPSKRKLTWPNGAVALTYTSYEPDQIRGPQFDWAWCDELSSWKYLKETWDNLMMALRLGRAQCLVTTTPKPLRFLRQLYKKSSTVVTGGSTYENAHNLAPSFKARLLEEYEGTSLGLQELHAHLLEQAEGALWQRKWIEDSRCKWSDLPPLVKICTAVDPAGSQNKKASETGIITAGAGWPSWTRPRVDPVHYYILHDASGRWSPDGWGRQSLRQLEFWKGDRIVGETNFGGDMVKNTITSISADAPFSRTTASRGKIIRAEMPAALAEQGRIHHCGIGLGELEDQLCMWEVGDKSPDRLDAMVWAIYWLRSRVGRTLGIRASMLRGGESRPSPWRY